MAAPAGVIVEVLPPSSSCVHVQTRACISICCAVFVDVQDCTLWYTLQFPLAVLQRELQPYMQGCFQRQTAELHRADDEIRVRAALQDRLDYFREIRGWRSEMIPEFEDALCVSSSSGVIFALHTLV